MPDKISYDLTNNTVAGEGIIDSLTNFFTLSSPVTLLVVCVAVVGGIYFYQKNRAATEKSKTEFKKYDSGSTQSVNGSTVEGTVLQQKGKIPKGKNPGFYEDPDKGRPTHQEVDDANVKKGAKVTQRMTY